MSLLFSRLQLAISDSLQCYQLNTAIELLLSPYSDQEIKIAFRIEWTFIFSLRVIPHSHFVGLDCEARIQHTCRTMQEWIKVSLLLCTFGFFREMRPSEPFVTDFLSGEWRNITSEQVNREIYPLGTYSYLAQLVIIFLITDILR